ncbi:DUF6798 domain-containing protein [Falsiroseomonas sp. HW251]|uniref:DUF6798 domain-containing protein n=1 Tax=Falsiroseomonas sp. HW251 TaxID=3390998 RepID=UPI003D322D54
MAEAKTARAARHGVAETAAVGLPMLCVIAAVAAALTILVQGFVFGWSNNLFQVPFVEGWFDDPAFANDAFVQSLRFFASWVWSLAGLMAPATGTEQAFLILHIASRFLMMLTAALLVREVGPRGVAGIAVAMLALALADGLHRTSRVGGHDLYYWFFSHSGVTWPVILLSLLALIRGHVVAAVAANGVVFGINGFVAATHGVGLLTGALGLWPKERAGRWRLVRQWLLGLVLALLVGAPTLVWVWQMLATQPPPAAGFDGRDFLWSYWPEHWWVSFAPWRDRLWAVLNAVAGLLALLLLGKRARVLLWAYCGYAAVFALAGLLPHVTHSLTILNLHPLRIGSGLVTFLATLAVVAATARALLEEQGGAARRWLAAIAMLAIAWGSLKAMPVAVVSLGALLAMRRARPAWLGWVPDWAPAAAVALLAALVPLRLAEFAETRAARTRDAAAQREIGDWLRERTPAEAMVLVPAAATPPHSHNIQVWARRRFWVDWKRGGAVQWSPHYHAEWSSRLREVQALRGVGDDIAYACANGIGWLVETPERLRGARPPRLAFRTERYAVVEVAPGCAGVSGARPG